ncbi:hypothetical protein B0H63DRAFT_88843 [Podospora didyma]|uniref:RNA polymerase II subunit A C-terminal domain phosphatase n=1 Tax=Podospora didyma TaxID=330526 RepID=A0AAE0K1K2_9PEZI|nr:hypothetical protein B0H63DRAFT_88843 [Podospora didyma]
MSKIIQLGNRLRYPITVVKLLKSPGDAIKKQEALIRYSFKWMKEVGDTIRGETWEEEQTTFADWDSPADGDLKKWLIKEGDVIGKDAPCMLVQEACPHSVQYQGLCALCGKDMTEVNWAAEARDTERAPISMVHDQTNLTVSQGQAQRTEQDLQRRLLSQRKLSLVVDLDQTIIHACIDPTVGEWQNDPTNPNHESVKAVRAFQLEDGPRSVARGCWYYIKMRPGLEEFLQRISELYELHVYTMGTRAYAEHVAEIVDPDQKLFGNRVISRDENGNVYAKSLQRLFPVSTNMVLIIDDRSDVWPQNRDNLIKVSPYDFFKGIGDINSGFLPKRQDLLSSDATAANAANGTAGPADQKAQAAAEVAAADKASPLVALASVGEGEDADLTQKGIEEQERDLERQIKDRPLQLLQEKLDKEDEEAEKASTQSEEGEARRSSSPPHTRHRVLLDDDQELFCLQDHLIDVHKTYYEEYDRKRGTLEVDPSAVPDVGQVLGTLKSQALDGVVILLTGIIPTNIDVYRSEIGVQLMSFGAELRTTVTRDLTHVVVNSQRPWTQKLRRAARYPHIKIVNQNWLVACFTRWEVADETPFMFHVEPATPASDTVATINNGGDTETEVVSEEDEAEPSEKPQPRKILRLKRPTLKLVSATGESRVLADDGESDESDDVEALLPDDIADGQLSPIDGLKTFNWGSADDELNEFLASGSDDDDDDDEEDDEDDDMEDDDEVEGDTAETGSEGSKEGIENEQSTPSRKRKRNAKAGGEESDTGTDSELASASETASASKKLRKTKSSRGTTSLRNQYELKEADADSNNNINTSSLPTPQVTGDEDDVSLLKQQQAVGEGDGFDDIDEAELMAEFEAEFEAVEAEQQAAAHPQGGDQEKG